MQNMLARTLAQGITLLSSLCLLTLYVVMCSQVVIASSSYSSSKLQEQQPVHDVPLANKLPPFQQHRMKRALDKIAETRNELTSLQELVNEIDQDLAYQHLSLENLERKRQGLETLRRILAQMNENMKTDQKRMCRFNLGGHCATESAAAVADQWHYLNSPLSPGRRRRDNSYIISQLVK